MIARKTLSLIAVVASACLPTFARTIIVQPQPVSPYADTEVSTNVVINKADISYSDLHFAFAGTPTNSLELAFGTDANTNGVLEAEEIASRFGWRSGRYFIKNAVSGEILDGPASNSSQSFSIDLHLESGFWRSCLQCSADMDMAARVEYDACHPSRHGSSV